MFNISISHLSHQRVHAGITEEIKKVGKITDGEQMKKVVKGKYFGNGISLLFLDFNTATVLQMLSAYTETLIAEYERNGIPKNFVDQVFGGEMTSTIMCQRCQTVITHYKQCR